MLFSCLHKEKEFRNGFIYYFVEKIIIVLKSLNAVEWFKSFAGYIAKNNKKAERVIPYKNIAIDLFIIIKWVVTISAFYFINNRAIHYLVIYFILFNIFTYFYYHTWNTSSQNNSLERGKRRFINTMQAICYNIVGYAYLYAVVFTGYFNWDDKISKTVNALNFSVTNTLLGSASVSPNGETGIIIVLTQYISTFILITIILSATVPNDKN